MNLISNQRYGKGEVIQTQFQMKGFCYADARRVFSTPTGAPPVSVSGWVRV